MYFRVYPLAQFVKKGIILFYFVSLSHDFVVRKGIL